MVVIELSIEFSVGSERGDRLIRLPARLPAHHQHVYQQHHHICPSSASHGYAASLHNIAEPPPAKRLPQISRLVANNVSDST